jgi:hypothetical protein
MHRFEARNANRAGASFRILEYGNSLPLSVFALLRFPVYVAHIEPGTANGQPKTVGPNLRKSRDETDLHEASMKIMDNTWIKLADSIQRRQRKCFCKALIDYVSLIEVAVY